MDVPKYSFQEFAPKQILMTFKNILKTNREKKLATYKGNTIRLLKDFSAVNSVTRKDRDHIFKSNERK